MLFNPRLARNCTICGTPLEAGLIDDADAGGVVRTAYSATGWLSVYLSHVFVMTGLFMIVGSYVLIEMDRFEMLMRSAAIPLALIGAGVLSGLALAEWSRRRGTMLHRRRAVK